MDDRPRGIRELDQRQLGRVIDASPRSRVVTVRGEAGLGKTTLLTGLADEARQAGWRVLRATGSTAETRLSLAGLHQLLRPLLGAAGDLPPAQGAALDAAFGRAETPGPAGPLTLYLA